jgi:uncharacterized protein YdeI (YjbR/CyaY-like superfamily)
VAAAKEKTAKKKLARKAPAKPKAQPKSARTLETKHAAATELPILELAHAAAWLKWLQRNHGSSTGVWIKLAKKSSKVASITYAEAVDGALRWGWIDGQGRSHDAQAWLQKFTPRRARSIWSKINRDKALALIARGEMQPPGLAEIERAKGDGRWEAAYDSPRTATVPADFERALADSAPAAEFFTKLNAANRYAILWRLQTAKRPETRARRISQFVAMLARGEKLHP